MSFVPAEDRVEYFNHDKYLRYDLRIQALRERFGVKGYAVYLMMLEVLTDEKYLRLRINGLEYEKLLATDFEIPVDEFKEIFSFMCQHNLFKVVTFETGNYIVSADFEKRL